MNTSLIELIQLAWSSMSPPFRIVASDEGDELGFLDEEFKDKPAWQDLDAKRIDTAPDGYSSALSFFAPEAFRYYIAAFMVIDLREGLEHAGVVFALTHGLDDDSRNQLINSKRFGQQRWIDVKSADFSMFDKNQVDCIIAYLQDRAETEDYSYEQETIFQALENYWRPRRHCLDTERFTIFRPVF